MILQPTNYFGKTRHLRSLENYHLTFSYHNAKEKIPKHHHKNPYLSLNLGAEYIEDNGISKNIIKPGTVVLRPSNYEHQNTFNNTLGLCFNIELTSNSSNDILSLFKTKNIRFSCLEFLQVLNKVNSNYLDDELDCLITESLLGKLENKKLTNTPIWYHQIIDKVKEDYNTSLTLSFLAKEVSLHPNYLARKFKKISGVTLGDYIRMVRIENACLMLYSKKRLTDISLEAGFYDQPHFSNAFRSIFNTSPRELRNFYLG